VQPTPTGCRDQDIRKAANFKLQRLGQNMAWLVLPTLLLAVAISIPIAPSPSEAAITQSLSSNTSTESLAAVLTSQSDLVSKL